MGGEEATTDGWKLNRRQWTGLVGGLGVASLGGAALFLCLSNLGDVDESDVGEQMELHGKLVTRSERTISLKGDGAYALVTLQDAYRDDAQELSLGDCISVEATISEVDGDSIFAQYGSL